ncbi:MAG: hypothetical protein ACK5LG_22135 [Bacteroides thetaiotaomicron]
MYIANYSAEDLIEIAISHFSKRDGDFICHDHEFQSETVHPLFWEKLGIVLGREVSQEDQINFFLGDPEKGSGRSTREAVKAVDKLLSRPGEWIEVTDHYQNFSITARNTTEYLVINMLIGLGVKYETKSRYCHQSKCSQVMVRVTPLPAHRIYHKCKICIPAIPEPSPKF